MNKQTKLLNYLSTGHTITSRDIVSGFGLANPHDAIYKLRRQGYCIYSNRRAGSDTVEYRIGAPSKRMVAVANRVLGTRAFRASRA